MSHFLYMLLIICLMIVLLFTCNTVPESRQMEEVWLVNTARVGVVAKRATTSYSNSTRYQNLSIFIDSNLVYHNPRDYFDMHFGLLPIVQPLSDEVTELLLGFWNQKFQTKILRLQCNNKRVLYQDTLPAFNAHPTDLDRDRREEFSGYLAENEVYCVGCDSAYYNPLLFYEITKNGVQLDSAVTKKWIEEHYDSFYGFRPNKKLIVPLAKQE